MAGEIFIARQDTLESVKGTVEDIDTNLGTPDYAGGGTDVVAMVKALASAVTTLQSDIDSVKTAIAGIGGGLSSCIKSIQRGVKTPSNTTFTQSINTIDPNKTIVLLQDSVSAITPMENNTAEYTDETLYSSALNSLSSNSFTCKSHYMSYKWNGSSRTQYSYYSTSWQVIEFY